MRVSRIELQGVTTHDKTTLELPEKGLVLVSGTNGSGKSSLIQAVPWTIWGKSLSGAKLWSGKKGSTSVTIDDVSYRRSQKKPKISWPDMPDYEKDQFAQDELTRTFGEFDHWRRSCVISSLDVSSFATAKDADRKRILEDVAGSALLESAYRVALARVKDAEHACDRVERELASTRASVGRVEAVLSGPVPVLPELVEAEEPDLSDLEAKKSELQRKLGRIPKDHLDRDQDPRKRALEKKRHSLVEVLESAQDDLREIEQGMSRLKAQSQAAKRRADEAEKALSQVQDTGDCPVCLQTLPSPEQLVERYTRDKQQAEQELQQCRDSYKASQEELEEVREDSERLRENVKSVEDQLEEFRAQERKVEREKSERTQAKIQIRHEISSVEKEMDSRKREFKYVQEASRRERQVVENALRQRAVAEKQLRELREQEKDLEVSTTTSQESLLVAKDSAKVLSTKGIRSHILDGLISAIQNEANVWLEMICGDRLRLELDSHGENTDGSRKEVVSFAVHGAGGGLGYQASSGGERRRIDIAITLALALVSEAASGKHGSTIFLDEALDSLDREGIESVLHAISVLAEDRCVVLVSHAPESIVRKQAVAHYRVVKEDGVACLHQEF